MTMTEPASLAPQFTIDRAPGMLIGGRRTEAATGRTRDTADPSTEEVLATVPEAGPVDVDLAVAAARAAFEPGAPWRRMSPADRGRIIHRIGELILEHADELALLDCLDNGKPLSAARHVEVPMAASLFDYMSGWSGKLTGRTLPLFAPEPGQFLASTSREPIGVVGQIIPWNYPLMMASWKLAPALAAGCTIVLKPAEQTPLSALRLAGLFAEAGLPEGVVNIVTGDGIPGAALAAHPGVDKIAFTGSTEVGREIVASAAGNLKKVTLELGGKSPNLVFADADLEHVVAQSIGAIFFNQGESCIAGSRLYVQRPVFDQVVAAMSAAARTIVVGRGTDPATQMGPLVSAEQLARVAGFVDDAATAGATIATGGRRIGDRGYFYEPTIVTGTSPDMRIEAEEVFGPVLVAIPFDTEEEAVALANRSPYGLAAGVFTGDTGRALRVSAALQAGTVWVNTWNILDASLPFGGYKQSGWGREMGEQALDAYLETKSTVIAIR